MLRKARSSMRTNKIRFRSILHISSQARVRKIPNDALIKMVVGNKAHKLHSKIPTKNTIQKRVYIDINPKTPIPNRAAKSTPSKASKASKPQHSNAEGTFRVCKSRNESSQLKHQSQGPKKPAMTRALARVTVLEGGV